MEENSTNNAVPRKRSLTEITLGWLAERVRRAEKIKEQLDTGSYKVDSNKIANAIANGENKG